ncbi:MAG: glycosyltransferase family 2 protein [Eubacterium sp.]|nr:glycosyltransferase family 2 protein [Eubacterium sp.]
MLKILLIIPAYNEEKSIVRVVEKIRVEFPDYDYVVINDGSTDDTLRICREHGYSVISHPVNLGLAGAFQTGMKYACLHHYDAAMQFDADGQHQPEYVEKLIRKMESDSDDIVIGSRFVDKAKGKSLRMLGNTLLSWAIRLTTGQKISDPTSGMRLYGKTVMQEFAEELNYGPESDTIAFLIKKGAKVGETQVEMKERTEGTSYLTLSKSISYMTRMLVSILLIQGFRKRG